MVIMRASPLQTHSVAARYNAMLVSKCYQRGTYRFTARYLIELATVCLWPRREAMCTRKIDAVTNILTSLYNFVSHVRRALAYCWTLALLALGIALRHYTVYVSVCLSVSEMVLCVRQWWMKIERVMMMMMLTDADGDENVHSICVSMSLTMTCSCGSVIDSTNCRLRRRTLPSPNPGIPT